MCISACRRGGEQIDINTFLHICIHHVYMYVWLGVGSISGNLMVHAAPAQPCKSDSCASFGLRGDRSRGDPSNPTRLSEVATQCHFKN